MKARDIIPGWPRGRSTTRPMPNMTVVQLLMVEEKEGVLKAADAYYDIQENVAEQRRKADMMESWYLQQRIDARGSLRPETSAEKIDQIYPLPMGFSPEMIRYVQAVQRVAELCCGVEALEGLGCGCCPGGKHQW